MTAENVKEDIWGRKDHNDWRIRTKDKLQLMYGKPNIETPINVRKLWRAGHLVRMSDCRTVKKSISGETRWKKQSRKTKIKVLNLLRMIRSHGG